MKEYKTTPQHAGIAQAGPLKRPLPIGTATGILNVKATGVKTSARLSCDVNLKNNISSNKIKRPAKPATSTLMA
jgi:hypothetical protein